MSPDKRQLLDSLDAAGARAQKRAILGAWISVGAAGVVLAGLVFAGAAKINESRTELEKVRGQIGRENDELVRVRAERRRLEEQNTKLKEDNANLALVRENYVATAAPQSEANLVPEPVLPGPDTDPPRRAYLQIVHPDDRQYAEAIGKRLGRHGFRVMGVELVERAARLKNTEVRYYKKADEVGAVRLVDALKEESVASPALLYLNLERNTSVRPNHYEVWFAAGVGRNQPIQPNR